MKNNNFEFCREKIVMMAKKICLISVMALVLLGCESTRQLSQYKSFGPSSEKWTAQWIGPGTDSLVRGDLTLEGSKWIWHSQKRSIQKKML